MNVPWITAPTVSNAVFAMLMLSFAKTAGDAMTAVANAVKAMSTTAWNVTLKTGTLALIAVPALLMITE